MKVLILGGTGAMGVHLVELMSGTQYNVTVTSRSIRVSNCPNINFICGNAMDTKFIVPLLKDSWDVIIDFMAYTEEVFAMRVEHLLNAASQYIFLSSSRVYAECNGLITEESDRLLDVSSDDEYLKTDDYALSKARQENILRKSGYKNWTIIRPYITYSENRLQLGMIEKENWLFRAINGNTIVFSNDISLKYTTLTYGLDVAKGIISVIGKHEALCQIFHITSNKSIKWNDVLEIYLDVLEGNLGFRPNVSLIDKEAFVKLHPYKYAIIYDRLYDRKFDNRKITNFITTDNFMDAADGLKLCLEKFLKQPKFGAISWRAEAKKDKMLKEYTSILKIEGIRSKLVYLICRFTNF